MKKASSAPVYAAMYHELAELARKHGYALAIHGSLQRDFDLIAIPWTESPSPCESVVTDLATEFALKQVGEIGTKPHGRKVYTLSCGWGECFLDLGFMPVHATAKHDAEDGDVVIQFKCECGHDEVLVTGWEDCEPIEGECLKCGGNHNL